MAMKSAILLVVVEAEAVDAFIANDGVVVLGA
jgi:hypothetical protein